MKKAILYTFIVLTANFSWSQSFDPGDNSIYYTIPGPAVVQAQLVAGVFQDIATFPLTRFNNQGPVNGLGCNPMDSCLYYINNSGGQCHLYKLDAGGTCTLISSTLLTYAVNGGVDACGNYIQYFNNTTSFVQTNIQTGIVTTYPAPTLGFITDIDYNPYTCEYFNVLYNPGNMLVTDTTGVLLSTFTSPQAGTTNVGGGSISPDGTEIYLSKLGSIYTYDIVTGAYNGTIPLNVAAAGSPIADMATFQYDDTQADISSNIPNDTLYFVTCDDSVDVTFTNLSTGNMTDMLWDFGDGTTDNIFAPTHKFESNNTYEVIFMGSRFTCETCQIGDENYDTVYVVIDPDVLQTTVVGTDPLCVTSADGNAEVTAIVGGTAPYAYSWPSSGGTNPIENGLDAGWVYVEVTGANGCFNLDSAYLTNPAPVEITLATIDATCFGFADGSAQATPVIGAAVYNYTWSTSGNVTALESNVLAGNHTVTVMDLQGCDTTYNFSILEPTEVTVTPFNDTTICIGGSAVLNAVATGGNGAYILNWAGLGTGIQNVAPIANTCYDVYAEDVNGCISATLPMCVDFHTGLSLNVAGIDICPQTDVNLTSVTNGGFGAYSFTWDNGSATVGNLADLTYPQSTTTTYCLTVSDQCETPDVTECITINVFAEPALALAPHMICEGELVQFEDPAVVPTEVISYNWQFGDGGSASGSTPSNTYDVDGFYTVIVDIVSADNCVFQSVFTDLVEVAAVPHASFNYNPQRVTVENTEVDFFNTTTDANSYIWMFGDNTSNSIDSDPSHIFPEVPGASFEITLHAYNGVCHDSVTQVVHVDDILLYYVPNAFTPDGDEYNEEFKPVMTSGFDFYDYHMTIFNKWGEIVFESYHADFGWNGHYGSGGLVDDGTYIWQIQFGETLTDKVQTVRGHVTVLK